MKFKPNFEQFLGSSRPSNCFCNRKIYVFSWQKTGAELRGRCVLFGPQAVSASRKCLDR